MTTHTQGSPRRPLADRPDLVQYHPGGHLAFSNKAMAYLFGIDEAEMDAECERQNVGPDGPASGAFQLPKAWIQQGKANSARLGVADVCEMLTLLIKEREQ